MPPARRIRTDRGVHPGEVAVTYRLQLAGVGVGQEKAGETGSQGPGHKGAPWEPLTAFEAVK